MHDWGHSLSLKEVVQRTGLLMLLITKIVGMSKNDTIWTVTFHVCVHLECTCVRIYVRVCARVHLSSIASTALIHMYVCIVIRRVVPVLVGEDTLAKVASHYIQWKICIYINLCKQDGGKCTIFTSHSYIFANTWCSSITRHANMACICIKHSLLTSALTLSHRRGHAHCSKLSDMWW